MVSYTHDTQGNLTGFTYMLASKPATISLPNGTTLTYGYDAATGRLVSVTDALGNRVAQSYDDQGNITETGYYLPSSTRTFRERFDYQYPNRPGKLWKRINPDDSFFEFAYDAVGNMNQVTDCNAPHGLKPFNGWFETA